MKTFKKVRTQLGEQTLEHDYHHTSINKINPEKHNFSNHPMWLSHTAHQATGWHENAKSEHDTAHTYSAKVNGKIAHYEDNKVKELLHKHGVDQKDYNGTLVGNPESHEVHDHPATKILQKHGYVGYTHSDYDPHDFSKDHDSTVVFHRKDVSLTHKHSN